MLNMGLVEKIRHEQDARKRRLEAARAAEAALKEDERREFFAEIYAKVEVEAAGIEAKPTPPASRSRLPSKANGTSGKKTDRAEAFVFAHPNGVSASEVADEIGQRIRTAESTLRQVKKTRKSIVRRSGKWFPAGERSQSGAKITLREAILKTLDGGKKLGTRDIFHGVLRSLPAAKKGSVAAEIMRAKRDGLVVIAGQGPRGLLYASETGTPPRKTRGGHGMRTLFPASQEVPSS